MARDLLFGAPLEPPRHDPRGHSAAVTRHFLADVPHDRFPEAGLPVGRAPPHLLDRLVPCPECRRGLTVLVTSGPARLLGHELQEAVVLATGEKHRDRRWPAAARPPELLQVVLDRGGVLPVDDEADVGYVRLISSTSAGRTMVGSNRSGVQKRNLKTPAPMSGVYGPEGKWLIEQEGFIPDIIVDNLPHATFQGRDAQLEAAIAYLEKKIAEEPRLVPKAPAYPRRAVP